MRIVSWNIQKHAGIALDGVIAALRSVRPDVLLLQAVTRASLATLSPARTLGLEHVASSIEDAERAGKYAASVIVSRWPLVPAPGGWARAPIKSDPALASYRSLFPDWDGSAPRPWLFVRARLRAPTGEVDVVDVQMPDTSNKGWDKLKSFLALAGALAQAPEGPRLVGGDFTAPRLETAERVVCFAGGAGRGPIWEQAGRAVITELPRLRDVYRAHHGYHADGTNDAYSYIAEGTVRRRFDHLFASAELRTDSVEYRTDWLHANLSDHAPLIACLSWPDGAEA